LQTDRQTKPFRSVPSTSAVTRRSPTLMSFFLRLPFPTQTDSFQRITSGSLAYARILAIGGHLGESPHFYVAHPLLRV
jgi:hypothetical protein